MASNSGVSRRQLLGAGAFALAPAGPLAAQGRRPNIVFVLADDLGYADVSCYGRPEYKTPNIDGLAARGTRFMQAYANSAVCSATRTGLITGRYQNRLPVGLEEPLGRRDVGLPPSHPTLPSLLKKVGYQTGLVGKWHLGEPPKYGPLLSGYDHFWGFHGGGLDYFQHTKPTSDLWDDDRRDPEPGYLTDLIGQHAIGLIDRYAQAGRPFFLSVHFNSPHWPWEGPDDEKESERLAAKRGISADSGNQKVFGAMVTRMDFQIGRILEALKARGLEQDTIVIFTSDNGGERYSDTWPFTGKKTELLEGGLRIPAIVRWPGHAPEGVSSEQVMISMDWLPTLLAAAGGAPDPAYPPDGIDIRPWIEGRSEPKPRTLCWRYLNLDQEACRDGDFKYLKILENTYLFNVVDDPQERANLKDRLPEVYARQTAEFRAWDTQMLPLDPNSATWGFSAREAADHFGINHNRTTKLGPGPPLPRPPGAPPAAGPPAG
jgi:arylsulfatase A-like enzyme